MSYTSSFLGLAGYTCNLICDRLFFLEFPLRLVSLTSIKALLYSLETAISLYRQMQDKIPHHNTVMPPSRHPAPYPSGSLSLERFDLDEISIWSCRLLIWRGAKKNGRSVKTTVNLHPHRDMTIKTGWMNANKSCRDSRCNTVIDNWILVTVSLEFL